MADVFLGRYDGAGNEIWTSQFGSIGIDKAYALAPDGAGGGFVAGGTKGDLGGPNAGIDSYDVFLSRFDAAGNQLWMRQFGTSLEDVANALAPDGVGGVFVAGSTNGDLGGIGGTHFQWLDAWIARYDSEGNQLWLRQFGTRFWSDSIEALVADGSGGVFVAGGTGESLGGPSAGGADVYLARYDSAGERIWIRQFGTSEHEFVQDMASDGQGGVMITGWTSGDLGGFNAGGKDIYLGRFDSAGEQIWLEQLGSVGDDWGYAVAPDGQGGAWVAGYTRAGLGGSSDVLISQFASTGELTWVGQFGTIEHDMAWALTPMGENDVMMVGRTWGDLAGQGSGSGDVFLTRFTGVFFCYAECEGNYVLDIFDFLCFQNSFVNGEPYACNCNTSTGRGVCDLFDFLCFQNAFVAGCP